MKSGGYKTKTNKQTDRQKTHTHSRNRNTCTEETWRDEKQSQYNKNK